MGISSNCSGPADRNTAPDVTEAVVKMEILLFTGKEKLKTPKRQLVKITGRNANARRVEPGLAADKQIAVTAGSRDCRVTRCQGRKPPSLTKVSTHQKLIVHSPPFILMSHLKGRHNYRISPFIGI